MPDQFENEMKRRLQNYEEEPQKDLWSGIAPHLVSMSHKPISLKWILLLPVIMSLLPLFIIYMDNSESANILLNDLQKAAAEQPLSSALLNKINDNINQGTPSTTGSKHNDTSVVNIANGASSISEFLNTVSKNRVDVPVNAMSMKAGEENVLKSENIHSDENNPYVLETADVNSFTALVVDDSVHQVESEVKLSSASKSKETKETIVPELKKKYAPKKFSMYLIAMPTFGYQRIESNQSDNVIIESISRIPAFSFKRLGFRAEIGMEYNLTPRFKAFGGLLYYQRKQTIDYTEKQVDSLLVSGRNGEVIIEPVFNHIDKSIEYELKNIGIQVGLNYHIKRRTFLHTLGTGIELHKPLNKADFSEISQGFGHKPDYYVFYNLYYRLQYPTESRLKAIFQPSLNYSLYINQNLNAPFYVKPYGLGLQIGGTYNF